MEKQVIILFGAPGAGKGTQADLLSDKLGFFYFETSKALEKAFSSAGGKQEIEVEGKIYAIKDEKIKWESGELNSPPFVAQLVEENIRNLFDEGKNIILAGSPRTLYEAEKIMPFIENLYGKANIKSFLLEIKADTTIFRNSHRKICELMRHSILSNPETENLTICPLDGSKLVRRKGLDNPETIKVRLKEYSERTMPVFDYFEKNGFAIKKINGERSVADVYEDILKSIK